MNIKHISVIKLIYIMSMNQILPGLYLGSLDDSRDYGQVRKFEITHIVSIIESAEPYHEVNHDALFGASF